MPKNKKREVREVIDDLIERFKEKTEWNSKMEIKNEFISLICNEFNWKNEDIYKYLEMKFPVGKPMYRTRDITKQEIENNFKFEQIPQFSRRKRSATVDLIIKKDYGKFIAIEFKYISSGKNLVNELLKCVCKFRTTDECIQNMEKGYIIPLLKRKRNRKASGYDMMSPKLCKKILKYIDNEIGDSPIELIENGIILK